MPDRRRIFLKKDALTSTHNAEPDLYSIGREILLDRENSHYLLNVLRLAEGEKLEIALSPGPEIFEAILKHQGKSASVELISPIRAGHRGAEITLLVALTKPTSLEITIEKAVELGVQRMIIWQAERSVVRIKGAQEAEQKIERWNKLILSSAQQSLQNDLMQCEFSQSLQTLVAEKTTSVNENEARIICSLGEEARPFSELIQNQKKVILAIGPEGDFTPAEMEIFKTEGFSEGSLGYSRLRSETAAIAAICTAQALIDQASQS